MTRWLGDLNLCLAALGIFFAVALGRELAASRPLPRVSLSHPAPAVAAVPVGAGLIAPLVAPREDSSASVASSAYGVIVNRNLFDPSRSATSATPWPPGARPLLYGVVAGAGVQSRAYVADPVTKTVRAYLIGDTVGGWRLDQIRENSVVIVGPDRERVDVLLRDPSKPEPAAVAQVTVEAPAGESVSTAAQPIGPLPQPAPAAQSGREIRGAVPRDIGTIPPQLFRPRRAQAAPPDASAEEGQ